MEMERISKYVGNQSMAIVDAMAKIDANTKGILFIVDDNQTLVGALTDGDIRRWILNSGEVSATVSCAMNKSPKYLKANEKNKALQVMNEKAIIALPVLDEDMRVIDVVFKSDAMEHEVPKRKLSGVPVVIMAGGKGTRLYPYTKILPKPLVPIGDTPIVERIINYFSDFGMKSFYMTVNYKKAMIRFYFDEVEKDYTIKYVEENKPLGTGGSIKLIEDRFDKPIFMFNDLRIIPGSQSQ